MNIDAPIMKHITSNQPQHTVDVSKWRIPNKVQLADPRFNEPQHVDILLGAEIYALIMLPGRIQLENESPTLHESTLGWLIIGAATTQSINNNKFCGIGTLDINEQMKQFWEIEEYAPQKRLTAEESKCEQFFDATTYRDNGRFTVNIPLQNNASVLGDSKAIAFKRLLSIERKLNCNLEQKKLYIDFMRKYEQQGHMEEVKAAEIIGPAYYLPHHCVLKPSSSTTKLRVVFDASAKTSSNISLKKNYVKWTSYSR